ncbi:hypothetical protein M426DRAFT_246018 [Hypoxylon sp. CI-4A]|nr:hypothetical protein M426DRAFT_246018 [Hypoxylon sp. CI-4A]
MSFFDTKRDPKNRGYNPSGPRPRDPDPETDRGRRSGAPSPEPHSQPSKSKRQSLSKEGYVYITKWREGKR